MNQCCAGWKSKGGPRLSSLATTTVLGLSVTGDGHSPADCTLAGSCGRGGGNPSGWCKPDGDRFAWFAPRPSHHVFWANSCCTRSSSGEIAETKSAKVPIAPRRSNTGCSLSGRVVGTSGAQARIGAL